MSDPLEDEPLYSSFTASKEFDPNIWLPPHMKRRIHVEEYNPDDASSVQSSTGMAGTLEQLEGVGSIGTDGSGGE